MILESGSAAADGAGVVVPAEGMFNLRDLGGFSAAAGKRVKPEMIYRSDDLSGLTAIGIAALAERKIPPWSIFAAAMKFNWRRTGFLPRSPVWSGCRSNRGM
ncbi:hypothetical protein SDC9_176339 [bioreactor metagenome]|uniref:Uncharacterized protein n=1 Tax=bioreactor metagenome TaxID=1076179 RepID=A0A645GXY4_9ZZZZ